MVGMDDMGHVLRGKSPQEQARVAQSIMAAWREGRFPLQRSEVKSLADFVIQVHNGRSVDDTLLLAVGTLFRQFEQHLLTRARSKA